MISVFEPDIGHEEIESVVQALKRGEVSGSFGTAIPGFEEKFTAYIGAQYGVTVSNGTTALHLAAHVADIGEGDEVLVSASTNIASALCVHHRGGITVPVDSEDRTWNLDLDKIESLITPKTKAIVAVHLYGHPIDMDRLSAIAQKHNLILIEDCAEAHGAECRGRKIGTHGQLICFSFYANKLITTGEGGMVLTNDAKYAERLKLLRNLAFTKPRFLHPEAGYNFRMTGMQAALGLAQLPKLERYIEEKRRIAYTYNKYLGGVKGLRTPREESWARHVYWVYGILIEPEFSITRDQLMERLAKRGIETRTFFCPMNLQPFLRERSPRSAIECPVAEKMWQQGLYLPTTCSLDDHSIQQISECILDARKD